MAQITACLESFYQLPVESAKTFSSTDPDKAIAALLQAADIINRQSIFLADQYSFVKLKLCTHRNANKEINTENEFYCFVSGHSSGKWLK